MRGKDFVGMTSFIAPTVPLGKMETSFQVSGIVS